MTKHYYRIRVEGRLEDEQLHRVEVLLTAYEVHIEREQACTTLSGWMDQHKLWSALTLIRFEQLRLIDVCRIDERG